MKRKITAYILAAALGITGIPLPVAAQTVPSGKNTAAADPLNEIRSQELAMEQQEDLEQEEDMPAEDPDPLVLDNDGSVVPASQAAWVTGEADAEETPGAEEDIFSDGDFIGNSAGTTAETSTDFSGEPSEASEEEAAGTENEAADEKPAENSIESESDGNDQPDTSTEPGNTDNIADSRQDAGDDGQELELQNEGALDENQGESMAAGSGEAAGDFTDDDDSADDFTAGDTSEESQGDYQTVTLEVRDGQDITAPLNTLFLELKEKATDETSYKVIIPPGNYELTGTICMYSNMYLYAQGATITKTSTNKHLLLRLGNTKVSEGGYDGYRNVVIDGGTWDFNYESVADKDLPGGFVGFCIGHASNVVIKNATFLNNLKSHFLEFGGVKNAEITGCTFQGYYENYTEGGQECIQIDCCTDETNVFPQYKPYDGTTCEDFLIDGNTFENVFAGLGTHSMMSGETYKRITVTNNTFRNVKKRCIEFMNYEDSVAENNTMVNVGTGVDISAAGKNTHRTPGYTGSPDTESNKKIRVAGNSLSLAKTSSIGGIPWVCSGVKVAGYNMKADGAVIPKKIYPVKGVTIEDNQITGYGNGVSISLADTDTVTGNRIKMKQTSAYSDLGIYTGDSRGSIIRNNTVSGTANTGIYLYDGTYASGSKQKNLVSTNAVSATGGDGIYLQSVNSVSAAEKNTTKSAGGSGIHVKSGKNISVSGNACTSGKCYGIRIENITGGSVRVKNNKVLSNANSGIMLWKSKLTEVSGNTVGKNKANGIYANASVIRTMKNNTFSGNRKTQAVYVKGCKGWTSINRPSCKTVTARSASVSGSAAGSRAVTVYAQRSGKSVKLGAASVNKKNQFTVKIKRQKKNTALRLVSKDRYGNTVTVNTAVK